MENYAWFSDYNATLGVLVVRVCLGTHLFNCKFHNILLHLHANHKNDWEGSWLLRNVKEVLRAMGLLRWFDKSSYYNFRCYCSLLRNHGLSTLPGHTCNICMEHWSRSPIYFKTITNSVFFESYRYSLVCGPCNHLQQGWYHYIYANWLVWGLFYFIADVFHNCDWSISI